MAPQFEDQGGMETSDPAPLQRWATSMALRYIVSAGRLEKRRANAERVRRKTNRPHLIEYFHHLEDGYSHLAAQLLRPLLDRYNVDVVCHLVPGPTGKNAPEPEMLLALSRYDAAKIAPHYGLEFPAAAGEPGTARNPTAKERELADLAKRILAAADNAVFPDLAPLVGDAFWSQSSEAMAALAERYPPADVAEADQRITAGKRAGELSATIPVQCSTTPRSGTGASIGCITSSTDCAISVRNALLVTCWPRVRVPRRDRTELTAR